MICLKRWLSLTVAGSLVTLTALSMQLDANASHPLAGSLAKTRRTEDLGDLEGLLFEGVEELLTPNKTIPQCYLQLLCTGSRG